MRSIASIFAALACLLVLAGPASANDPTHGAVREYPAGTNLAYRFGLAGYPSWLQSATQTALGPDWSSSAYNNTRLPTFSYVPGSAGAVYYSSSTVSPCGTGNTQWLQCASNWGSTAWRIYVRNFSGAPFSNWTWCNISFSGTCWDVERALVHEAEHVTMGVGSHDSQGESNTVMGATAPWYPHSGWNTHHIQRCDQAAGQLLTGMATASGQVADCFGSVPGHGSVGLIPALTPTWISISTCSARIATLSGTFTVAADYRYQSMSGAPLGGRTIWFDRKPRTSRVWTSNIASATTNGSSGAWSRAFSTGSTSTITYDFRGRVSSGPGLDTAMSPNMTITWSAAC